ncbi:unnamed protein product [Acanthoscelides obtectus]|uniref:folate gamma-glutamyl hydrolase n=1 Tax=Acanthoscelides obtectus TaxID=200917 RepID=A0A9P0PKA3_ACAOB|nr:unnamed protein product [Acanthoscelides obtectus]CAK1652892.1 Gamma-glutamyl hydrolase [Acanthoscelides obtectus]
MLRLLTFTGFILSSYASDTPIIGILSQETYILRNYIGEFHHSFIVASYVKFLESAGARVIPVWIGKDDDYYRKVVNYTNGVLFPGGGTYFNETGGYGEAARKLYNLAKVVNDKGTYYPIFGVCLGLQVLPYAEKGDDIRTDCELKHVALPLKFAEDYEKSKMFSKAPDEVINILKTKNVTYNFHRFCLTEETLRGDKLLQEWKVTSTDKDINGIEFVSSMENSKYPFYGVQFHPEKNVFEFKAGVGIPHSVEAVKVTQYFANFFVEECRKNGNKFPDHNLEERTLIYNYQPIYTGMKGSAYEQTYVFEKSDLEQSVL